VSRQISFKALFIWNKVPLYYPALRPIRKPRLN
jgi:hypothetical protein